jgi:hypothetical protein
VNLNDSEGLPIWGLVSILSVFGIPWWVYTLSVWFLEKILGKGTKSIIGFNDLLGFSLFKKNRKQKNKIKKDNSFTESLKLVLV